jgi:hypothetical protein
MLEDEDEDNDDDDEEEEEAEEVFQGMSFSSSEPTI